MSEHFERRADEFVDRIRCEGVEPSTEVTLIYHAVDRRGVEIPPFRVNITPSVAVSFAGNQAGAASFAVAFLQDTLISNVNTLVRHLTDDYIEMAECRVCPIKVKDVELEIMQPVVEE